MRVIKCDFCGVITEENYVGTWRKQYEVCKDCKIIFEEYEKLISNLRTKYETKFEKESQNLRVAYKVDKTILEEEKEK